MKHLQAATARTGLVGGILLVLGLCGATEPAAAMERSRFGQDVSGRWGIGMVSPEAPVGVRYFWTRRAGLEAGLGFRSGEGQSRILIDGGWFLALAPGDRTNFFFRPGVRFRSDDGDEGTVTVVQLNAALAAEFFLSNAFSITTTLGVAVDFTSPPPGHGGDSVDAGTFGGPFTGLGFFFYLP